MNLFCKKLSQYLWFFHPEEILFKGVGLYSAVRVTKRDSRVNLFTGKNYLQTSINSEINPHGSIFDWYLSAPWFSGCFEGTLGPFLILGLGGGSQVKSYNLIYKVESITGVEIDPLIIELGKKYFDLNDANLETVNENACLFLDTSNYYFSLIIVDAFKKNLFEKNCQSSSFVHKVYNHLTSDGVFLVNKLLDDPSNQDLGKELKQIFSTVATLRIYSNLFFIATNSKSAPRNSLDAQRILLRASESYRTLRFFKSLSLKDMKFL